MNNGNPLMLLMEAARRGGNPIGLMQQMAMSNPQMAQAMKMIQGKSPDQLRQMAENMAKERGTSLEAVAQSLGLTLPK